MGRHRIGIVDDHSALLLGVVAALADMTDIEVAWCGASVAGLLAEAPDVALVVLDLRLADGTSVTANVRTLRERGIDVLAYTSGEAPPLIREAARADIAGLVRKSEPVHRLVDAIRAVLDGQPVESTDWAAALDSDPQLADAGLSPREREVLGLYASGQKAYSVANELGVSRDTVIDHVKRIRAKYARAGRAAPTKVDLYRRAVEDGLLPPE
ncbi:MAG: response regulator transcription factor [Chloroflexi bacterium]|nr:response regulator transcription factor [Chloroflexota bacterium]